MQDSVDTSLLLSSCLIGQLCYNESIWVDTVCPHVISLYLACSQSTCCVFSNVFPRVLCVWSVCSVCVLVFQIKGWWEVDDLTCVFVCVFRAEVPALPIMENLQHAWRVWNWRTRVFTKVQKIFCSCAFKTSGLNCNEGSIRLYEYCISLWLLWCQKKLIILLCILFSDMKL